MRTVLGETCTSYDDSALRGIGPSTPSQTAWAVLGLLAAGDTRSDSVAKGIRWLVTKQMENGSWDEAAAGRNNERSTQGQGFRGCFILPITFTGLFSAPRVDDLQARDGERNCSSSVRIIRRRTWCAQIFDGETPDGSPSLASLDGCTYVLKQKLMGRKKYPLVLMLEPLFRCNLACAGCGKIQYPAHILKASLRPKIASRQSRVRYPDGCDPGGEPLLHPQMPEIVAGLVARKKYVYMCTNALLLKESCTCSNEQVPLLFGSRRRTARAS